MSLSHVLLFLLYTSLHLVLLDVLCYLQFYVPHYKKILESLPLTELIPQGYCVASPIIQQVLEVILTSLPIMYKTFMLST